jgi:RNA polymerase sigma-70 factor (ECF subfamily)
VDPQATPVQQVVAQGLWQAAMRLPPGQREALLLNRIGGLRHEEVARVTGASPAAVRVALHRALRSLREGLGRP